LRYQSLEKAALAVVFSVRTSSKRAMPPMETTTKEEFLEEDP